MKDTFELTTKQRLNNYKDQQTIRKITNDKYRANKAIL